MNTRPYTDVLAVALNGDEDELRTCVLLLSERETARLLNALDRVRTLAEARNSLFRRLG